MSYIEKEMREKLTKLSTEIFGRPSLWRKLLENGYLEPIKLTDTHRKARMADRKHYTPETLLTFLEETKVKIEEAKVAQVPKFKGLDDAAAKPSENKTT